MTTVRANLLILTVALVGSCISAFTIPHHGSTNNKQQLSSALSAVDKSSSSNDVNPTIDTPIQSRRSILSTAASLALTPLLLQAPPALAAEDIPPLTDEGLIDVYFGCGCFWHVQHEFVAAEKKILQRTDSQITARAGYAGGLAGSTDGKVCYHNAASIADYGKLGHAEVVGLRIPPSKFGEFAVEYFKLFDTKGDRPDQAGDRGSEYRSLVGFPGGGKSEYAKLLVEASQATGDKLDFAFGKGDDKDARKTSFVMDTAKFPFFVAEQYHQFHDGFNLNENYSGAYNKLADTYAKGGEDFGSCPNGSLGLGFGGL